MTGKSGVGKTTILKRLKKANIFFADEFVKKNLYHFPHPVFTYLKQRWPLVVEKKTINTKKLGMLLFADSQKLEEVHNLVYPFVCFWLKSLPLDSIVEMAVFINYEKLYKPFFEKVILVTREKKSLSKFSHVEQIRQPIYDKKIEYDYLLENNKSIDYIVQKLKRILL